MAPISRVLSVVAMTSWGGLISDTIELDVYIITVLWMTGVLFAAATIVYMTYKEKVMATTTTKVCVPLRARVDVFKAVTVRRCYVIVPGSDVRRSPCHCVALFFVV